jgi:hypothetical protein
MKTRRQQTHSEIRYQHSAFVSTVTTTREVTKAVTEFLFEELAFLALFFPSARRVCGEIKLKET